MYNLSIEYKGNTQPWITPVESRIAYLMKSNSKKKCIIIYEQPDSSTFRYRGYNMYQVLKQSERWNAVYFFLNELDKISFLLNRVQMVILSRTRWNQRLQKFINEIKQREIPLAFDVDDCVFDLDNLQILASTQNINLEDSEMELNYWFAYITRMSYVAGQADVFLSTNDYLGAKLSKKFGKKSVSIPNFFNEEQLLFSEKCCELKKVSKLNDKFVIGYFSGSPSHENDFLVAYQDILYLMQKYDNIYLYVAGYMNFSQEAQEMIEKKRIRTLPFVDFVNLQRYIAEVDVNIVPLVENTFTNCKSELKFFESAIVDTITCASPTYTYKSSIKDGVNGFLCSPNEWYDKIEKIYLNQLPVEDIVRSAHKYAMENYYGDNILKQVENGYDELWNEWKC